jgi:hypothetical protein
MTESFTEASKLWVDEGLITSNQIKALRQVLREHLRADTALDEVVDYLAPRVAINVLNLIEYRYREAAKTGPRSMARTNKACADQMRDAAAKIEMWMEEVDV